MWRKAFDTYGLGGAIGLNTEAVYSGTLVKEKQRVALQHGYDAILDYVSHAEQSIPFLIKYHHPTISDLSPTTKSAFTPWTRLSAYPSR